MISAGSTSLVSSTMHLQLHCSTRMPVIEKLFVLIRVGCIQQVNINSCFLLTSRLRCLGTTSTLTSYCLGLLLHNNQLYTLKLFRSKSKQFKIKNTNYLNKNCLKLLWPRRFLRKLTRIESVKHGKIRKLLSSWRGTRSVLGVKLKKRERYLSQKS